MSRVQNIIRFRQEKYNTRCKDRTSGIGYSRGIKYEMFWKKTKLSETLADDRAWSYIKDFVEDNECIMFFNQEDEKEMFLIQSGDDLNYILTETYGFEFYITNSNFALE